MQFEEATTTYDGGTATSDPQLVVPTTGTRGTWETPDGLEITLPSGAAYEHEFFDGHERKHGWEQIKELPGINQPEDIGDIVRAPNAIEEDGRYDLIIGDNPGGDGQIILRVLEGYLVGAVQAASDPHRGEEIEITEEAVRHIIEDHDDWDHEVIGRNENEVRETLRKVIEGTAGEGADEVWKEPNQDRWMYVKTLTINGREITIVLFVMNGEVASAFAPTHETIDGYEGHTGDIVEYYIKLQEMVKKYAIEGNEIIEDVDIDDQAESIPEPDPP
ncbi:hypothetical protein JMJ58_09790 [Haloterrigena salifodinae]|uniref:Uncharacterized protein n=1 Tax=Haloterrigena salifodinae TaxID=2675099 RepID=A0A8T8E6N8_9EURY|nr:hypothetical protein [Haloterrigena salifodinae]QRV17132.1 hypothetical protein JMJ58_09790 [Haloterrigena salifodinae]